MVHTRYLTSKWLRISGAMAGVVAATFAVALVGASRAQQDQPKTEREVALEQLEIMRSALPALREGEKREAAEQLQQAIRAREVILERRRDEEAQAIRERAPKPGQVVEILTLSSRLWREYGDVEKATKIGELADQMTRRERSRDVPRGERSERERDRAGRAPTEREVAEQQLETMRVAMHAFREAQKEEAMKAMERAIHARELLLSGRRSEEAQQAIRQAPNRAQLAELLKVAARFWREYDQPEKAQAVGRLAEQLAAQRDGDRPAGERREGERREGERREGERREVERREGEQREGERREVERREGERREMERPERVERREGERREAERTEREGRRESERREGAERRERESRGDLEERVARLERRINEMAVLLENLRRELSKQDR